MITTKQLEEILSTPLSKKRVGELAEACVGDVGALFRLSFHVDRATAFRAAWVLESVAERDPGVFASIAGRFLVELRRQDNLSCQRHFTKILMFLTDPNAPVPFQTALAAADRAQVVETVFDWLINPRTPVAVAVNCLDILFYLSAELEWIREELEQQILLRLDRGSPAMDSRGKRVLKKLRKTAG